MQIALVYNAQAGAGLRRRVADLAKTLASRGHMLSHHDSANYCYDATANIDLLCICGGDGTARLVLERQPDLSSLPPVALYPAGTINLLARELDYPAHPQAFAARIERDSSPLISKVAEIGAGRFLACASVGVDAWAVSALSLPLKARIGRLAYLVSLARMLWHWPCHRLEVVADGTRLEGEALFVLRGHHYAGPWTLDPAAGLTGDRLRLLVLPRARRRDIMALALYGLTGARWPQRHWRFMSASDIQVSAGTHLPVQADGDIVATTPVTLRLGHQAVKWK